MPTDYTEQNDVLFIGPTRYLSQQHTDGLTIDRLISQAKRRQTRMFTALIYGFVRRLAVPCGAIDEVDLHPLNHYISFLFGPPKV